MGEWLVVNSESLFSRSGVCTPLGCASIMELCLMAALVGLLVWMYESRVLTGARSKEDKNG
jgi:hypothetical protein